MKENQFVVRTSSLTYGYASKVPILKGIDLEVERGSIYGFLGPNGSGKTTTISLLLGLLRPQGGIIELFGQDPARNRSALMRRIGALVESPSLYGHLTAAENLEVYRTTYGVERGRIPEVLKVVGLEGAGTKKVRQFSLGMRQRLAVALALLPRPELLILDEPTNGLDPSGIIELRELVQRLSREEGLTIFLSSHILPEVEKMATHLGIILGGRMVFQGPTSTLMQGSGSSLRVHTSNNTAAVKVLQRFGAEPHGEAVRLSYGGQQQISDINRMLVANDLDVYLLQPQENDLEQLFIHLTTSQS